MAKAGLLFVGTDDGLVLFSNPNNIGRWLKIGQPFRGQAVGAVWPLADSPLVVCAAVAGMGLQRSEDGGQSWRLALEGDVSAIVGVVSAPRSLYLSTAAGAVYGSEDGGASWSPRGLDVRGGGVRPHLAVDREAAPAVYAGLGDGAVLASRDGGASWAPFGASLPAAVAGLAVAARAGGVYAVAGGKLYRGAGAAAWQALDTPGPARGPVVELVGQAPALLVALEGGGIARSDDGGATWAEVGDGKPVDAISAASYHMDTAFAGGAEGALLVSSDRGRSWEVVKPGLPPIRSIAVARLA